MDFNNQLEFLKRLSKGITEQFGENCEVAIHDIRNESEHTIVSIENAHVTGRHVGDGPSNIVLESIKHKDDLVDHINYLARTKDGKILKSSTIYIRDEKNNAIGVFSINYDITDLILAERTIKELTKTPGGDKENAEVISSDVNELLDLLIEESYKTIGKPVSAMSKEDKIKAIKYLDKKGAFLIKKSGDKISRFYDISKYTLYNYMDSEI